ncbi:PE-PGRS family protein [Streptomyces himastatinicus ATCC 53653]|uniref:PE-PGRS family protein n=1 Tax=Streptomyces himastatinicus ATCC 53653 TaxID=457427 RepID=D9WVZ5_9ACTN|nr:hypothetical protein [Streptomyces himastatinicus]EFL24504.1 PE-PGRS family protein [Streptomyces himastatinicus ATCC 53653]
MRRLLGRKMWLADPGERIQSGHTADDDKGSEPEDGALYREIRMWEARRAPDGTDLVRTFAYPERPLPPGGLDEYRKARKQGSRSIVLWADPHRERKLATVVTRTASRGRPATYDVADESGAPLGSIVREPAARGGQVRTRWTVQQTGRPAAVGHKGHPFWWVVWWLLWPVQLILAFLSILEGASARTPRRTKWRIDGETVLDWHDDGYEFQLSLLADWWDERLIAALVALEESHESRLGDPWDNVAH